MSNTGIAMALLGNRVCFNTRVGDDDLGRLTVDRLCAHGNTDGIRVAPGSTSSYTVVIAPPGIDRVFLHHPGTNHEYGSEDVARDLTAQCRIFHFGYPPLMRRIYENEGEELERVFRIAKDAGATTSCDMSLPDPTSPGGQAPWDRILERILPHIDIFLPSIEEAFYMLEKDAFLEMHRQHSGADMIDLFTPDDYTRLADRLLAMGTKMTSLKSGHRGFYVKTGSKETLTSMGDAQPADAGNWSQRELWCPAFHAPHLAAATGSGDSSIAGFLSAFLRGTSIEEALKTANCLGWQNVQVLDAVSGIKSWDETLGLLARKMPMNEVGIQSPRWRWHDGLDLWSGPHDPLSTPFAPLS